MMAFKEMGLVSRLCKCAFPVSKTSSKLVTGVTTRFSHTSSNPAILQTGGKNIHLLGTMHIAEASADAARDLITKEHRKGTLGSVFLELDSSRFTRLKHSQHPDESLLSYALSVLARPDGNPLAKIVELGIGSAYRGMHKLGFASGVEFKAAIETAERLHVPLVLGDQDIKVTMNRVSKGFQDDFNLAKLMSLMMANPNKPESSVERRVRQAFQAIISGDSLRGQEQLAKLIDRKTVREIIKPMEEFFPGVTRAMLHERDVVMTKNLHKEAFRLSEDKNNMVAIVGLAHMEGIATEWDKICAKHIMT